jgi:hypothetical protein
MMYRVRTTPARAAIRTAEFGLDMNMTDLSAEEEPTVA